MRPVLQGDVATAARALLAVPESARPHRIARLIREAEAADRHRRRTGRAHPVWGDGSLMTAAGRLAGGPVPGFESAEWCRCWILVFEALIAHRARQPDAQETQRGTVGSSSSRFSGMSSPQSRHSP